MYTNHIATVKHAADERRVKLDNVLEVLKRLNADEAVSLHQMYLAHVTKH
jgi:hypothetical protein